MSQRFSDEMYAFPGKLYLQQRNKTHAIRAITSVFKITSDEKLSYENGASICTRTTYSCAAANLRPRDIAEKAVRFRLLCSPGHYCPTRERWHRRSDGETDLAMRVCVCVCLCVGDVNSTRVECNTYYMVLPVAMLDRNPRSVDTRHADHSNMSRCCC